MNILGYFVDKTKFVNILTILVLVCGLVALQRLKRESFPKVDFEISFINTVYPGASPEDVEVNVTIPIEEELRGINGLKRVVSASQEGLSSITVTIDSDEGDKDRIKGEIQKAVDRVTTLPPEVVNRPSIWELKTDNFSVIQVSLAADNLSEAELRDDGRELKRRLERLSRVAKIELLGFRQREYQIQVDPKKLPPNMLALSDIVNILRARNVRIPAGEVRDKNETKNVVTEAKFQTLDDIRNTIVRTNFEGQRVAIKDVAEVVDTFAERKELIKMNGRQGVTLNVLKKSNADVLRTVDQVRKEVEVFRKETGQRLQIDYINDVSKVTRSSLGIVIQDAWMGMLLIIVVLLLFLDFRTALWTAAGIPFALAVALVLMLFFDISINDNSLIGLIIVSGLLADDSIVMAEAIYAFRAQGYSALESARKALASIAKPVLATVITAMLAFAPLLLLPGILGKFIFPIPMVVIVTLVGSLFEAFFILPNHLAGHATHSGGAASEPAPERKWFEPVKRLYARTLTLALRHRYWLIGLFVALFVGTLVFAFSFMKFQLFPQQKLELAVCYLEAQRGASIEEMDRLTGKLETFLAKQPAGTLDSYTVQIGRGRNELPENPNIATLTVYFPPAAEQKNDTRKVVADLKAQVKAMPEFVNAVFEEQKYGPPVGRDVDIKIFANDNSLRQTTVAALKAFLSSTPGVTSVESSDKAGKTQLALTFDHAKLARYGLNASEVGLTLRTALEGSVVSRTYTPEERIDYRILLKPDPQEAMKTLRGLYVNDAQRRLIPITDVIRFQDTPTIAKIEHYDYDRVTVVTANVDRKQITPVEMNQRLKKYLAEQAAVRSGWRYEIGGEARESSEAFRDVGIAFLVSLLLIFFVLVLQFDSFFQPFIILASIPFAIVGVIWTFAFHGLVFSFLAMIGLVGLMGIVVNDAMIMVDTLNARIREKGCRDMTDYLAVAHSGALERFRPIFITTVTTLAGVLPTAYGFGGYVEQIATMVLGLGWGLLFAAFLTLFLVPGLFLIEVEVERKLATWFPWLPLKNQCENPFDTVKVLATEKKKIRKK